jgi:hypothetical protein
MIYRPQSSSRFYPDSGKPIGPDMRKIFLPQDFIPPTILKNRLNGQKLFHQATNNELIQNDAVKMESKLLQKDEFYRMPSIKPPQGMKNDCTKCPENRGSAETFRLNMETQDSQYVNKEEVCEKFRKNLKNLLGGGGLATTLDEPKILHINKSHF